MKMRRLASSMLLLVLNICPLFTIKVINGLNKNELEEDNQILIRERSAESNYNFCLPENIQLNYGSNRVRITEEEKAITLNIYSRHQITLDVTIHLNDVSYFHSGPDRVNARINSWELPIFPQRKPFWSTIEIKALASRGYWHISVRKLNGLSRTIESWEKTNKNLFVSLEVIADGIERYYIGDPVHDCSKYSDPPTTSTTEIPTTPSTFIPPTTSTTEVSTPPSTIIPPTTNTTQVPSPPSTFIPSTTSTTQSSTPPSTYIAPTTSTVPIPTSPSIFIPSTTATRTIKSHSTTSIDTSTDVIFMIQRILSVTYDSRPIFSGASDYSTANPTEKINDSITEAKTGLVLKDELISTTPSDITFEITNTTINDSTTDNISNNTSIKTDYGASWTSSIEKLYDATDVKRENFSLMSTDLPMIFGTSESFDVNDTDPFYSTENNLMEHEEEYIDITEPNILASNNMSIHFNKTFIVGESRWAIPRDFVLFWSIPIFALFILILVTMISLFLLKKSKQRKVAIKDNNIAMKSKDSFRLIQDGSGEFVYRSNTRMNPIPEQTESTISLSSSQFVKSEHEDADCGSENDPIYSVSFSSEEYNLSNDGNNTATLNLRQLVNETETICYYGEV